VRAAAAIFVSLLGLAVAAGASAETPPDWKQEPWRTCRRTMTVDAIAACTTIIDGGSAIPPKHRAYAYSMRGEAYRSLGKPGHAMQDLDEALRIDTEQAYGYAIRGYLLMELGQNDRSLRDFNHALSLNPDFPFVLVGRSRLFFKQGEFARSIHDADAVLRIDAQSARAMPAGAGGASRSTSWRPPLPIAPRACGCSPRSSRP